MRLNQGAKRHSATLSDFDGVKQGMPAPDPAQALRKEMRAAVRAVYAELERRPVERSCTRLTECCRFKPTGRHVQRYAGLESVSGALSFLVPRWEPEDVCRSVATAAEQHFLVSSGQEPRLSAPTAFGNDQLCRLRWPHAVRWVRTCWTWRQNIAA